jgi:FKBP-type peptidyl-prolyl cis-trans isomerase FklB
MLMKQFFSFLVCLGVLSLQAQTDKAKLKTTAATTAAPVLKTNYDSASYAIGMSVANFYRQQGITRLNSTLLLKGINDVLNGKTFLNDAAANTAVNKLITESRAKMSKATIDAGNKFLAENKNKPGVKTTASGLQYEVLQEGNGEKPTATSKVTCHYRGTLIDGTEFDNSYTRGKPATFSLTQVIKGWTEGLPLMNVGAKYRFWVPYMLGYGLNDHGNIPAGSALIFEVELLSIDK